MWYLVHQQYATLSLFPFPVLFPNLVSRGDHPGKCKCLGSIGQRRRILKCNFFWNHSAAGISPVSSEICQRSRHRCLLLWLVSGWCDVIGEILASTSMPCDATDSASVPLVMCITCDSVIMCITHDAIPLIVGGSPTDAMCTTCDAILPIVARPAESLSGGQLAQIVGGPWSPWWWWWWWWWWW